jgi:hypothetical protein
MILPNNGRIVIVDDQLKEAEPLINVLSRSRIPFNYYSGTRQSDFPQDPNQNKLRVLFLDLNIFELNRDAKTVISSIHAILESVIPDSPNPYLLVIWSKQSEDYRIALEDHFERYLPKKIPAKIVFFQKGKYFDYIVEQGWIPQVGCLERLEQDLTNELGQISLLRNLIAWENIIHLHSSETINEFSSFFPIEKNWDRNSKGIMYRLAKAVVGNDDISALSDEQKLAKAFISLNSFLSDKVEKDVENLKLGPVQNINDNGINIDTPILSLINSKLHTSNKGFSINHFEQGNIYLIPNEDDMINKIIWDKKFKQAIREQILGSNPQLIQLDITPVCDYSQDKRYVRVVYGLILSDSYKDSCNSQYFYPTPIIRLDNQNKFLLFDFRQIKTLNREFIIQRNISPYLKLRREICTDIQSQLANQVNRPGISNV